MAQRAKRNTFGFEQVSRGLEVRRQIKAGDIVWPGLRVNPEDVEETRPSAADYQIVDLHLRAAEQKQEAAQSAAEALREEPRRGGAGRR